MRLVAVIELADVFRRFADGYMSAHGAAMPASHRRAIADIMACRTELESAWTYRHPPSRLDPEDLGQVIRAYQDRVRQTMARFGGFIALYMGDGVLIYFGWPEAREAEAEWAVRAALAVAAAVGDTPVEGEILRLRIGVATGLVVVGESIGAGDARQRTVIGGSASAALGRRART